MMNSKIEKIKNFRLFLLTQLYDLTIQQLNTIPPKFNNNIIWNLGHLICAEQNICYVRAGVPVPIDNKYFSLYMPGTKPEKVIEETEIKEIKQLLITSIDQLQSNIDKHIFENYSPSVMIRKVYGFEVSNIDQALEYLLYHEGLHGGYILSLKRLV